MHPLAAVTGNVIIGKNCYIGPGAAIRGDWGEIILEDGVTYKKTVPYICFQVRVYAFAKAHI